ncbi:MAG: hypothetical protein ACI3YB_04575 [Prevotella sp.]
MNKKIWITFSIVGILLIAGIVYLVNDLQKQKQENKAMQELAELDKKEMENEYKQFANQYSEMKSQITNDSLIAQLTAEQEKTQKLLDELKSVKSSDAREIARLKKELATMRAVLRSYVIEIDSLNRLNQNLMNENTRVKGQYSEAIRQIEGLGSEKASLSEKVAIAAQLDATGINMTLLNKRDKSTSSIKKCKKIQVSFTVAKNVTAKSGMKTFYVRVTTPTGALLGNGGSFEYENRTLQCTMKKSVEYGGQEISLNTFWEVSQTLVSGTYQISIFADGNMIGSKSLTFK